MQGSVGIYFEQFVVGFEDHRQAVGRGSILVLWLSSRILETELQLQIMLCDCLVVGFGHRYGVWACMGHWIVVDAWVVTRCGRSVRIELVVGPVFMSS